MLRLHLRPRLGDLRLRDCTVQRLDTVIAAFEEEVGASRAFRAVLTNILGYATRKDALPTNPMRDVDKAPKRAPKDVRAVTPDDFIRILALIDGQRWVAPRGRALLRGVVMMMAATGERIGEVLALRVCDVIDLDSDRPVVWVNGSVRHLRGQGVVRLGVKSRRPRAHVLPEFIVPTLRERLAVAGDDPGAPLFGTSAGTWMAPRNSRRTLDRALLPDPDLAWGASARVSEDGRNGG